QVIHQPIANCRRAGKDQQAAGLVIHRIHGQQLLGIVDRLDRPIGARYILEHHTLLAADLDRDARRLVDDPNVVARVQHVTRRLLRTTARRRLIDIDELLVVRVINEWIDLGHTNFPQGAATAVGVAGMTYTCSSRSIGTTGSTITSPTSRFSAL